MEIHRGYGNVRKFFNSENASSYDSIVHFTTFGLDSSWKKQIINIITKQGSVLDLACGTGILSSMLTDNVVMMRVIGLDLVFDYLRIAKKKRKNFLLTNGTAEILPYKSECFDFVVSSYLAKYVDIKRVVDESWRILNHDGTIVFHDFTYPKNILLQNFWRSYFVILKMMGYLVKSWKVVFHELCQVIRTSGWIAQMKESLEERGFKNVSCKYYTFGMAAIISAIKP
ncbi:MAG TPA: class I SAM-dependent methyltransferase [Nitrososphaeraceae archaeon]|nr:class I SAM-dependent methyltransferase [Nitrososphaeraceae archaeon]